MDSVVVLNRNFEYWTETDIHKVLKWIVQKKVEIVVSHETEEVGSVEFRVKVPFVVRLLKFVGYKPKTESIQYSAEAVFQRDNYYCQYWHYDKKGKRYKHQCDSDECTLDHVYPSSRGGETSFLNCVTACHECNINIKKNMTPEEAGLELVRKPFVPIRDKSSFVIMRFAFNPNKVAHKKYREVVLGI